MKHLILLLLTCPLAWGQQALQPEARWTALSLESPTPAPGAEYGFATATGDFNGDGCPDLLVGAPGQSRCYVAWGPDLLIQTPVFGPGGRFGHALDAADIDGDGVDEALIGAPGTDSAWILQGGALSPLTVSGSSFLGRDVRFADLNGDGVPETVVSDPDASTVYFWWGSIESSRETRVSPFPGDSFGHSLAATDYDGDGFCDLVVSAPGRTSASGVALAGQVAVLYGPEAKLSDATLLEAPAPVPGDNPRFGMHVEARGRMIAVGTPREDVAGSWDVGVGRIYHGSAARSVQTLSDRYDAPDPLWQGLWGYRALIGDFVGGPQLDVAFVSLWQGPQQGVWLYNRGEPWNPRHLRALGGSSHHFAQGAKACQLVPGGKDEIVLGDNSFAASRGRVVVYGGAQ